MQQTDPGATGRRSAGFRPDIEGMRGIAVLLVVLFHAGPFGVTGGFIGVDLFFVLSGFLITGLLLREGERTRRIDLRAFYARRIRRLLPAGAIVLTFTLLAAPFAVAPLDLDGVAKDGAAAALSVANLRFALESGYFARIGDPSPFLHFWSLSVEEQFYLLWPLLVAVVVRVARPRLPLAVLLAAITAASFAACVALTAISPDWAFYLLPTRAWQLGLGGLLAILLREGSLGGPVRGGLAWVGLAALLASAVLIGPEMAWPGALALIPSLAGVALIAGGQAARGPGRLLAIPPLRFFGRISYALYLWHWPLLILPATAIGAPLSVEARLLLVALAIALATISTLLIEEPIRAGRVAAGWPSGRTIGAGLLSIGGVVALSAGLVLATSLPGLMRPATTVVAAVTDPGPGDPGAIVPPEEAEPTLDPSFDPDDLISRPTEEDPVASAAPSPEPAEAATAAPVVPLGSAGPTPIVPVATRTPAPATLAPPSPSPAPTERPARTPRPTPVSWVLPANVKPPLALARDDDERLREDGCLAFEGVRVPPECVYGNEKGRFVVALVGDSHAAHWFPAIERVAKEEGWKLLTFTKVSCPFTLMPVYNLSQKRDYPECADFVRNSIERLQRIKPDLVLTSQLRFIYPAEPRGEDPIYQGELMGKAFRQLPGIRVVIAETPWVRHDVPGCLSRNQSDVRPCNADRWDLRLGGSLERQEKVAKVADAALIDFTRFFCDGAECPVAFDGYIRFRDDHHMTATFARSLAPYLGRALQRIVADARATPAPSASPAP